MGLDILATELAVDPSGGSGMVLQAELPVGAPGLHRANRAWHEAASASRADIMQHVLDAISAVGAFIGADARLGRLRRQVLVTQFAIRAQFEHRWPPSGHLRRLSDGLSAQRAPYYGAIPHA